MSDLAEGDEEYRTAQRLFLKKAEDGIFSLCMALRRIPSITYSVDSKLSQKIAERLSNRMEIEYTQNHKEFLPESMDILIFDRREDPITPLIYNWSYQSLINEFIGIEGNTIKIQGTSEVFARQTDDAFLDKNWIKNFGEFTKSLSEELEKICKEKSFEMKLGSLVDMQAALEKLPDLNKDAKKVKKHSDVIRMLVDVVKGADIYHVSQLQQDIIMENNKPEQFTALLNTLTRKQVSNADKLKLVMLYCLKYHSDLDRVNGLKRAIAAQNLPEVSICHTGAHQEHPGLCLCEQEKWSGSLQCD